MKFFNLKYFNRQICEGNMTVMLLDKRHICTSIKIYIFMVFSTKFKFNNDKTLLNIIKLYFYWKIPQYSAKLQSHFAFCAHIHIASKFSHASFIA